MLYKNLKSKLFRTLGKLRLAGMALAGVVALTFTASSLQPVYADTVTPPPMPDNIKVLPEEGKAFLVGHAIGYQNYVCKPSGAGVAYVLFTPQAILFGEDGGQVITHFFSANLSTNPSDPNTDPKVVADGAIRATWEHSRDSSRVWAATVPNGSATHATDPLFVEQGAVAWLKLKTVGTLEGPTGGDRLATTTFVQRLNTHGGLAPSTGCSSLSDLGNTAFMPYTADYFFYK